MEILSPVGAHEQLIAAVRGGANAVYLGMKDFNARRNADNFSSDSLTQAISYCHARNVKVYITLNTLIKEKELEKAANAIREAAKAGADAIIVQDLAMYRLCKLIAPQMQIHASTQMSVHNLSGVKVLESLKFSRVVPARELSLDELKYIRTSSNIELEVFVHGALCMSVSGQCYLSSILGARSANRGLCAQPCRLDFKNGCANYALSLKDLSIIDKLTELKALGIDSAKIEGRMKRPEYVYASAKACTDALSGNDFDIQTLKAIFSRSGFTNGYYTSKLGRDMFGYRTKDDVTSAAGVLKNIANSYRNETPLVKVDMHIKISQNSPTTLTVWDKSTKITVRGDIPQAALTRETDKQLVLRSLEKCGGTPYYLGDLICDIEPGLCLPMSSINTLRKSALELFEAEKGKISQSEITDFHYIPAHPKSKTEIKHKPIIARFESVEQICENVDKIILDYEILYSNPDICKNYKSKLIAELPTLLFSDKDALEKLLKLKEYGINAVYATNLYVLHLAKEAGLEIFGAYSLNILNSISLEEYVKLGVKNAEISFETSIENFDSLSKPIPCGLIVYGKMPLMTFRNCPAKTERGCGNCNCKASILDRYNNEFTVMCHDRKYSRLINPNPIYMGDKLNVLKNADYLSLYFTNESPRECIKIINMIKSSQPFDGDYTRGLYFKEIY